MLTVRLPPTYRAEREYVARVLLEELLGLDVELVAEERDDTAITDGVRTLRCAEGLFGTPEADLLTERALPRPAAAWDVPVLYGTPSIERDGDTTTLGVDLFGGAFFLLTRLEELVVDVRDEHGRFPASAAYLVREGLHRRPVVNEYADLLWKLLTELWPSLERRERAYRLIPSHDVDWPLTGDRTAARMLRRAAADVVRGRDARTAGRRVAAHVTRRKDLDVNNTFDAIMDVSERNGVRSTFFFIAGRRTPQDGDYSLDDPWIRSLLRRIHARGHEIGLHASYTTQLDPAQTRIELETLRRVLDEERIDAREIGSRQHYLRWANPQTWRNCDDAGIAYDASVGFAEELGFRSGICVDHPVFDLERRRTLAVREQPLVVMEGAALDRLGLSYEEAAAAIADLEATCRRHGGTFTLLWHNSRLVHRADMRLYREAIGG